MHKQKEQAMARMLAYHENPKSCDECGGLIAYVKRNNRFCSKSCSAIHMNRIRTESGWVPSEDQRRRTSESLRKPRKSNENRLPSKNKGRELAERRIINCLECNSEMRVTPSDRRKYCGVECRSKHMGGAREKSGRSNSGYYRGIYCGSTYELVWVIYRLDHNMPVTRFDGFIIYGNGKKYFPDFVENNIIHEMKGWCSDANVEILAAKNEGASRAGYTVKMYFREDLQREFDWVARNYDYKNLKELYDGYKPKYEIICRNCGLSFLTDNKNRKCCSRKCCGQPKGGYNIAFV